MNLSLFEESCNKVINNKIELNGIGTLGEKTIHSILKHYHSPNSNYHEIKLGNFVADILQGNEIIEIQTANFNKLRKKLDTFLPDYHVTIVFPISRYKYILWIDPETGEIYKPRKSTRMGSFYDVFPELYKIKSYLTHRNLHIKLMVLDVEEYRYLDGWSKDRKKGCTKCDRIPIQFVDEIILHDVNDYFHFVPTDIKDNFTSQNFAKTTKLTRKKSQVVLHILHHLGIVKRSGKQGNSYLYQKNT